MVTKLFSSAWLVFGLTLLSAAAHAGQQSCAPQLILAVAPQTTPAQQVQRSVSAVQLVQQEEPDYSKVRRAPVEEVDLGVCCICTMEGPEGDQIVVCRGRCCEGQS